MQYGLLGPQQAVKNIERYLKDWQLLGDTKFRVPAKASTLMQTAYRPELDISPELVLIFTLSTIFIISIVATISAIVVDKWELILIDRSVIIELRILILSLLFLETNSKLGTSLRARTRSSHATSVCLYFQKSCVIQN